MAISNEFYNKVVNFIIDAENYINKLYSDLEYVSSDSNRLQFLEEIEDFRILIDEYTKYKIIYESQKTDDDVLDEALVIDGDTLQSISAKFTGTHENWQRLYDFNDLSDVILEAGSTIKIPRDLIRG
jgi:LysM domain